VVHLEGPQRAAAQVRGARWTLHAPARLPPSRPGTACARLRGGPRVHRGGPSSDGLMAARALPGSTKA
jgi:hypothetical protein